MPPRAKNYDRRRIGGATLYQIYGFTRDQIGQVYHCHPTIIGKDKRQWTRVLESKRITPEELYSRRWELYCRLSAGNIIHDLPLDEIERIRLLEVLEYMLQVADIYPSAPYWQNFLEMWQIMLASDTQDASPTSRETLLNAYSDYKRVSDEVTAQGVITHSDNEEIDTSTDEPQSRGSKQRRTSRTGFFLRDKALDGFVIALDWLIKMRRVRNKNP